MKREVIVSSGDALKIISLEDGRERLRVLMDQAGALCASNTKVFSACGSAIWMIDRKTLALLGLAGGGRDVCSLLLSQDETRLYALCAEADSVLMLDAQTGDPMFLNRAGVNPREMTLDGEVLAIAGGESGMVLLFCAKSLRLLDSISMPGPVLSVQLGEGRIHTLCMTAALTSLLVTNEKDGTCCSLALSGMPGRLLLKNDGLLAATEGSLYLISRDGKRILQRICVPGRAAWLADAGKETLLLDEYAENLLSVSQSGIRKLSTQAKFAVL